MRWNERRIKFIRIGEAVRTVGLLKAEQTPFMGQQPIFTASRQRKSLLEWQHDVTG